LSVRALYCHAPGWPADLRVEDVTTPGLGIQDVKISVAYAAVNFPDLLLIQGKHQIKPALPFIPGSEAAGTVVGVGAAVDRLKIGQRVMVHGILGMLAEEIVVKEDNVHALPPEAELRLAAALPNSWGTGYHALFDRARIGPNERLLVLGAGSGVGLSTVAIGRLMGAKVIAVAGSEEKQQAARAAGAEHLIRSDENLRGRLQDFTAGEGVDVVVDVIGGTSTVEALKSMAWGGRLLIVGFASGNIAQIPANLPLMKGCDVLGVQWGMFSRRDPARNRRNLASVVSWWTAGKIQPRVWNEFSLEETPAALAAIGERRVAGKAVIKLQG
jgi:NADPH2:quinone reductase